MIIEVWLWPFSFCFRGPLAHCSYNLVSESLHFTVVCDSEDWPRLETRNYVATLRPWWHQVWNGGFFIVFQFFMFFQVCIRPIRHGGLFMVFRVCIQTSLVLHSLQRKPQRCASWLKRLVADKSGAPLDFLQINPPTMGVFGWSISDKGILFEVIAMIFFVVKMDWFTDSLLSKPWSFGTFQISMIYWDDRTLLH